MHASAARSAMPATLAAVAVHVRYARQADAQRTTSSRQSLWASKCVRAYRYYLVAWPSYSVRTRVRTRVPWYRGHVYTPTVYRVRGTIGACARTRYLRGLFLCAWLVVFDGRRSYADANESALVVAGQPATALMQATRYAVLDQILYTTLPRVAPDSRYLPASAQRARTRKCVSLCVPSTNDDKPSPADTAARPASVANCAATTTTTTTISTSANPVAATHWCPAMASSSEKTLSTATFNRPLPIQWKMSLDRRSNSSRVAVYSWSLGLPTAAEGPRHHMPRGKALLSQDINFAT